MFDIIRFVETGRYGLRNRLTGIVLTKKSGQPCAFRTQRGAVREMHRRIKRFNKMVGSVGRKVA